MAAEFHLAEDALALHLFLQHPEGLVDIVVTDENLHGRYSSIERLMGPTKAPGPLAHAYAQFGCRWHPRYEPTSTFEIVPCRWAPWLPIGRNGDFGTSPFFGQLFGQVSACLYKWACRR